MENNETKIQRLEFILEMIPALLEDLVPIFIDETGISLNSKKTYAWIPRGEELILEVSDRS